jgi:hypothetical protein
MEISIKKYTDEALMRRACEMTMHGETSNMTLEKIYKCEHSPIRTQMFWIEMLGIPSFASTHFVRHKIGVEHFVSTNREDRGGNGEANRWTPVNHGMLINAQALINMARKRLCYKAHHEVRKIMEEIFKSMCLLDVDLANHMVPECEYRNGCHELRPCGYFESLKKNSTNM